MPAVAIEALVSRALGVEMAVVVAQAPARDGELTRGERARVAGFATQARREEWLLGRAALKSALRAIGEADDTAAIELPHPRVSLTHSGGVAIAAAAKDPATGGIGVDLEVGRSPRLAGARFFLGAEEESWVRALPEVRHAHALLRLWTIKEAAFKADRKNASATLRDYRVVSPGDSRGEAERGSTRFAYVDTSWGNGSLAVAVHRGGQ
jgi:phosphopantetheinyl transferase